MNLGPLATAAFFVAALAAAAAILSDGSLEYAVPMGALAVAAAGGGGAVLLGRRVELRRRALEVPEGSPVVSLAGSFRAGPFGRRAILATLAGLERNFADGAGRGLDEEARLLTLSDRDFEAWVRGRIARLERET